MGATAVLLDVNGDNLDKAIKLLKRLKFKVGAFELNLTNKEEIDNIINLIIKRYKRIDVLINAAAFAMNTIKASPLARKFFDPYEDYLKELWDVSIDVNLTGTFLITQSVGRQMKKQGSGNIINIASDVAVISPDHRIYQPNPRYKYKGVKFNTPVAYSVSKAGVLALTRYLATYWAKDGIRVNSLSPAGVYKNQDPKFVEQLVERIPLGRMAFPEEMKGPIVFLASEASSFMTGGNLIIDGGRTSW
jgi:NAD(P)-dependent dehydrogenase (short-subunit alcohol dehydrogenase family)